MSFVLASKAKEYLFESCLGYGIVLDPVHLPFDCLHDAEQRMPRGGGIRNVEVDVVKMLISHNAARRERRVLSLERRAAAHGRRDARAQRGLERVAAAAVRPALR